jgi:hypothetical protein
MPSRRKTRKQRGGAHTPRKSKTSFHTLRSRPVGHEKPSREFHYETTKPITVRGSTTKQFIKTKKSKTQKRPPINLTQNLPIQRKSSTYQYVVSVKHVLKQLESELEDPENDFAANIAIHVGAALTELEVDLGLDESEYNANDYSENIEEIREIVDDYLKKYDKVLKSGKMSRINSVEVELELIAITLDKAFQEAKDLLAASNNANEVDELSDLLGSLKPFRA